MKQSDNQNKTNVAKVIDRCCRIASCAILFFMVLLLIISKLPAGAHLPSWLADGSVLRKYLIPISSSAAVGYLTNAIAIWMLFKPYEKHWFWPQGVIPSQKKSFGHELGILIPQHLLQPEKISAQIGKVVLHYLKDPRFVREIRIYVKFFLAQHSDKLAKIVVPYVQNISIQAIRDNTTRDNFNQLCQLITHNFLNDVNTRTKTVHGAVAVFKDLLPNFSDDLKSMVAKRVADSFRQEHPFLSILKDVFTKSSVEDEVEAFWHRGEKELLESLDKAETQEKIAEYFAKVLLMSKEWTEREENTAKIDQFLCQRRENVEKYVGNYLADKIPVLADELLSSDSFWTMLQEKALPALQLYVVKQLRGEGGSLLAEFRTYP